MSKFLVLLALVAAAYAAGNSCKTGNIVNRLVNNQSYYWPSTWNENQTAPRLEKGQTCSWIVTIPQGYYARLVIDGKMEDKDSRIQMIDSVGNLMQTTHEKKDPYFFPPAKFTLAVSNEAAATFAFKIQWFQIPQGPTLDMGIGSMAVEVNATNSIYNLMYGASNGLSMLVFPEDRKNYHSLRSTLIFEATGFQLGNYVTSLYAVYQQSHKQFIFNSNIALVNLEVSGKVDLVVLQNADYVRNYNYVELVTVANSTYNATVNSEHKTSALISCTYLNQTMVDVQMNDNDVVSLYYGTPNPFTFDRNYTGAELKSALPLFYQGYGNAIEWIVNSGKAVFTFQA